MTSRGGGAAAAAGAAAHFERVFVHKGVPDEIEELVFESSNGAVHIPALVARVAGGSRSEARRMLSQGAVRLDGEPLGADELDVAPERLDGAILQVGKRQFRRLRAGS